MGSWGLARMLVFCSVPGYSWVVKGGWMSYRDCNAREYSAGSSDQGGALSANAD